MGIEIKEIKSNKANLDIGCRTAVTKGEESLGGDGRHIMTLGRCGVVTEYEKRWNFTPKIYNLVNQCYRNSKNNMFIIEEVFSDSTVECFIPYPSSSYYLLKTLFIIIG